jgi:hypothetical protein
LLGDAAWHRLAPAIRERFDQHPAPGKSIRYTGVLQRVECSRAGFLLAQLCRCIGTPFVPWSGHDIPTVIVLRADRSGGAILWEREYRFPDRRPVRVCSVKRGGDGNTLLECVGGGFAMRLKVSESDSALRFKSIGYLWRCGRLNLRLPHLLSPGTADVLHQDLGFGRFQFQMTIHHRLLGTLFRQSGQFRHREG